jgi:hypothetical protein
MMDMFDHGHENNGLLPFPQGLPYASAARGCGASVHIADLGIGGAQIVQRGGFRLISRGPVWEAGSSAPEQRRALRRLARWPGLTLVTPEVEMQGPGLIPLITPMHHAVWDLAGDPRTRMKRNWRHHLTSAERGGICCTHGDRETLQHLVAQDRARGRARGYRGHGANFSLALPVDAVRLWEWRHGGQIAAAMAFVVEGGSASYHLAWAGPEARQKAVHNVMLWQAAMALRGEGVRWLDLGSVNDEDARGLAAFKLGTGAALRRLGHTILVLPG